MDSLDAIPSADYASLLTLSSPDDMSVEKETHYIEEKHPIKKCTPEHIYAQVTTNETGKSPETVFYETKDKNAKHVRLDAKANRILLHNTYVLRDPLTKPILGPGNHANSVPDIRNSNSSLNPNNYGSLNVTKVENKALVNYPDLDPSIFSISGRRVVVSKDFKGRTAKKKSSSDKESFSNLSKDSSETWSTSSSEDAIIETKRRRLQICTDCFSLCLFVPGTVLCILSPWLLVPIYVIPNLSGSHFQTLILVTCISSALLVFMGCMVGNVVWYRKGKDWKCLLHCGKGPKDHYWGDSLTSTLHTV